VPKRTEKFLPQRVQRSSEYCRVCGTTAVQQRQHHQEKHIMAKAVERKPNFPFKTCPKCGHYIHTRSKSHDACGWKDDSSPASKPLPKQAPAVQAKQAPDATNGEKLSKMEAVRRILMDHGKDSMPVEIQGYLQKQFGIKMDTGTISNYKSTILMERKKHGPPKAMKAWLPKAASAEPTDEITMSDIEAVKKLVDSMGAEKVRALAQVLAK
jgi:hypothetical protein